MTSSPGRSAGRPCSTAGAVAHPVVAGAPVDAALRLADAALYLAKAAGATARCASVRSRPTGLAASADLAAAERDHRVTLQYVVGPAPVFETMVD